MTPEQAAWFQQTFARLVDNVGQAVLGKPEAVKLAFTCLLAGGHMLLEDFPGTGKTSLARSLAATVQASHSRIQFTPDLLPSDVTGVTIFDQNSRSFEFHPGPIFASIVLADEINRASPKTQSALLEVMEEGRVTVDGTSYSVGKPFVVIATQNPIEQAGTYRLPEAQLDRFLLKLELGYPDTESAIDILAGSAQRDRTSSLNPIISTEGVEAMSQAASGVYVERGVLGYINGLVEATRVDPRCRLGSSVRGGLALVRAAKVWAASQGRHYVIPDDVKALATAVLAHRLVLDADAELTGASQIQVVRDVLATHAPPAPPATHA